MNFDNLNIFNDKDNFKFECNACGMCCLNREGADSIIVSTYDLYNLSKGLKKPIREIGDEYLKFSLGGSSGIVVATIKSSPLNERVSKCIFLNLDAKKSLCSVHKFKPSVCAMYPLGRMIGYDSDELNNMNYVMQKYQICQEDKLNKKDYTIKEWVPNLELSNKSFLKQSEFIKELLDIINLRKFIDSDKIPEDKKELYISATLDLWYYAFSLDKDYFEQVDEIYARYLTFLKSLVSISKDYDKNTISKFKDFYHISEAYENIITLLNLN